MAFPTTYLPSIKKKLLCIIDQIEQHDYDFNATPTNGIKPWLKELSHLAAAGTDLQVEACLRSIAFHAAMIATPVNNTDEELGTAPTEPPIASTHKALDWVQQIEAIVGNIATKIGATPGVGANDTIDKSLNNSLTSMTNICSKLPAHYKRSGRRRRGRQRILGPASKS